MTTHTFAAKTLATVLAVLTLGVASSAWAECAWVLWMQTENLAGASTPTWDIDEAFSTRTKCVDVLEKRYRAIAGPTLPSAIDDGSFAVKSGPVTVRGKCIPDSVDPRGPKASGR